MASALSRADMDIERKFIYSPSHIAVKERGYIKVYRREVTECFEPVVIDGTFDELNLLLSCGMKLNLKIADIQSANRELEEWQSSGGAPVKLVIDAGKLKFPLTLRCVEAGDKFRPFGMDGVKKINDYLSDLKIDTVIKGVVPVLCNGIKNSPDTIICMPGLQISNSYRVSDNTGHCLIISVS